MKDAKGFTRTVGGRVVGLSAVRVDVRGGEANRECGGGPVTTGEVGIVVGYSEGRTETSGGKHGTQWEGGTLAERWTLVDPGWLGTASGVRAASMGGVNFSEGRDFINWHASP